MSQEKWAGARSYRPLDRGKELSFMPKLMGIHYRILSEEWQWEPVVKLLQWVRQRQVAACSRTVPVQRT